MNGAEIGLSFLTNVSAYIHPLFLSADARPYVVN